MRNIRSIGELTKIHKGNKAENVFEEKRPNAVPYLQIEDLRPNAKKKYTDDSNGFIANEKDVLIAWDGANAGTVSFGLHGYIGSTLAALRLKNGDCETKFIGRFLQSNFNLLRERCTGATIPHIDRNVLESLKILLPFNPEQKRIAAILDKADRLRRQRRFAQTLSDSFLQSVFIKMFGDIFENEKDFEVGELGQKLSFMTSGSRGWAEHYTEKGDLFLRIQNVNKGELLLNDIAFVQAPDTAEARRTKVKEGDVLLTITAALGRSAVIPKNLPTAYINQHIALLRVKDINPTFVSHFITSKSGQIQIERLDREGVKSGLNFDDIIRNKYFIAAAYAARKIRRNRPKV